MPKHIRDVLDELQGDGLIQSTTETFFDFTVQRFKAHQPPDTSIFKADELGLIDWWVKHVSEDHSAASISELSHDYGWKLAKPGEEIPFKAFLASRIRQPRDGDELNWAKENAERIGPK